MTRPSTAYLSTLAIAGAVALLAACSDKSEGGAGAERPPVAVDVVRIAPGSLTESIAVVGTLTPKFEGEIKAEYSGTIAEVFVTEWVRVKRGTLLARFDRREIDAGVKAATAAHLQAQVAANRAKRELERMEQLKSAGLATQQNLDDARAAFDTAGAQLDAARAQEEMAATRLAKADVRATMDGVIASRTVNPGDFIENMGSPRPMFRIVDNSRLEIDVDVPSSLISRVRLGQTLTFATDAVPGKTFEGTVRFINPAADESSRTVKVNALVDNPDDLLKSGFFVKGAILTGERSGVLRIPRTALLTWDPVSGAGAVYVVNGDRAQRRDVTTGAADGDMLEVLSGLAANEAVVSRGGFNIREGDRITIAAGTTGA
ncbi:MAG: efflux RND transporter periplasmic adaptor subunit [Thermoanaerobaculia bacterium]